MDGEPMVLMEAYASAEAGEYIIPKAWRSWQNRNRMVRHQDDKGRNSPHEWLKRRLIKNPE